MAATSGGAVPVDEVGLEDGYLRVRVARLGAEVRSLSRAGDPTEYLWSGDPTWWERRAPVLFPIVGRLRGDRATCRDETVRLGQHGFARDRVFTLARRGAAAARFELRDDGDTRAAYPFAFRLVIAHRLAGGALATSYRVDNPGNRPLPFSLGAHPGFRWPLVAGDAPEDYVLDFSRRERAERRPVVGGLIARPAEPFLENERVLALRAGTFDRGAVVLAGHATRRVALRSTRSGRGVELRFPSFPYLGIWSKPGAPFVCLEPWCGIADAVDASGRLEDKEGIVWLAPGASFRRTVTIRPF